MAQTKKAQTKKHTLPELGYKYEALEPYIDARTMEIHYTKHHQGYVDKLNAALEGYPDLQKMSIAVLLKIINSVPASIRPVVQNNVGGHFNHSFFWSILAIGKMMDERVRKAINERYTNFETFKEQFTKTAVQFFGSGWVWLVADKEGNLDIITTPGHESPIQKGMIPLLVLDLWEHAYYLKYQNKRAEYIEAFFSIINWEAVSKNFQVFEKISCI